jgi:hypothetical protein
MFCPHCGARHPSDLPFDRVLEGGLAYAQVCPACAHIVAVRPHLPIDPPVVPAFLNASEAARLLFVRWRLLPECLAQTRGHDQVGRRSGATALRRLPARPVARYT